MSDAQTPSDSTPDDAAAQTTAADTGQQKKPRSAVERAIVWGGIGILLIVAGIQGMAAYGFSMSSGPILAAVEKANESSDELSLNEAEQMMAGIWRKTPIQQNGSDRFIVYSWSGVYQSYTITLTVGADESNPSVMGCELNSETSHHSETIADMSNQDVSGTADESDDSSIDMEMPMGMGGGPGGPGGGPGQQGGGRPSTDWDELDKDGDGKVSKEEAPERMQRFFDRIDTNGDGFIDEEEQEESRRRREERQNNGGGGGRPQRPTNDDDPAPTTTPDDEPEPPKEPEETSPEETKE
jgi:hypothetical protein